MPQSARVATMILVGLLAAMPGATLQGQTSANPYKVNYKLGQTSRQENRRRERDPDGF
jgi:hypothetical protein